MPLPCQLPGPGKMTAQLHSGACMHKEESSMSKQTAIAAPVAILEAGRSRHQVVFVSLHVASTSALILQVLLAGGTIQRALLQLGPFLVPPLIYLLDNSKLGLCYLTYRISIIYMHLFAAAHIFKYPLDVRLFPVVFPPVLFALELCSFFTKKEYLLPIRCLQIFVDGFLMQEAMPSLSFPLPWLISFSIQAFSILVVAVINALTYRRTPRWTHARSAGVATRSAGTNPRVMSEPTSERKTSVDLAGVPATELHGMCEMTYGTPKWETTLVSLLEAVGTTHWDKKPLDYMSDDELMAFRHMLFHGVEGSSALCKMLTVHFCVPDADPDMLQKDAAENLKREVESMYPHLRVLSVTFDRGSLLVRMKLTDVSATGISGHAAESIQLLNPNRTWLKWLKLPSHFSSFTQVEVKADAKDYLSSSLPDVVVLQPTDNMGASLDIPLHCDSVPDDVMFRASIGNQPMTVAIVEPVQETGSGQGPSCPLLHVEEGSQMQLPCLLLIVTEYQKSTRQVLCDHDVVVLQSGRMKEEQELKLLCCRSGSELVQKSDVCGRHLARCWALWMGLLHELAVDGGVLDAEALVASDEGVGSLLKRGARVLMELVVRNCPCLAELLLQKLLEAGGIWALTCSSTHPKGYNLLHIAILSGSTTMVDFVMSWIQEHRIPCWWDTLDKQGLNPLHLAAMMSDGKLIKHLLTRNDANLLRAWVADGLERPSPKKLAKRITLLEATQDGSVHGSTQVRRTVVVNGRQVERAMETQASGGRMPHQRVKCLLAGAVVTGAAVTAAGAAAASTTAAAAAALSRAIPAWYPTSAVTAASKPSAGLPSWNALNPSAGVPPSQRTTEASQKPQLASSGSSSSSSVRRLDTQHICCSGYEFRKPELETESRSWVREMTWPVTKIRCCIRVVSAAFFIWKSVDVMLTVRCFPPPLELVGNMMVLCSGLANPKARSQAGEFIMDLAIGQVATLEVPFLVNMVILAMEATESCQIPPLPRALAFALGGTYAAYLVLLDQGSSYDLVKVVLLMLFSAVAEVAYQYRARSLIFMRANKKAA